MKGQLGLKYFNSLKHPFSCFGRKNKIKILNFCSTVRILLKFMLKFLAFILNSVGQLLLQLHCNVCASR